MPTSLPADETDREALRTRVLDLIGANNRELADEVSTIPEGWLYRTPSLPRVWAVNQLRLSGPVAAKDVAALAERYQSDMRYRYVVVEDAVSVEEARQQLSGQGWTVDRLVVMALAVPPPPTRPRQESTTRISAEEKRTLMRRWLSDDMPTLTLEGLADLEEFNRREAEAWGERCYGRRDGPEGPVAMSSLRNRGRVGWVEDVYVVPEQRGKGYGRQLVDHAVGEAVAAGYELTFIIAEADGWPRYLYQRAGFEALGIVGTLHLEVGA